MNASTDDLDVVLRPHWLMLAFWYLCSAGLLVFWLFVHPLLQPPVWVSVYVVGMSALALLVGLVLSFAYVRVTPAGLVNRHFRRWFARWEDVEAWSQAGPGGNVFVRTRDGRVRTFSSWCAYGARCDRLASALKRRLGPGATGEESVAPRLLKRLVR